jgi:hypothetical protein
LFIAFMNGKASPVRRIIVSSGEKIHATRIIIKKKTVVC